MASQPEPRIFDSLSELSRAAAEEFAAQAAGAVKKHGRFSVALSGGSTPRGLFSLLASGDFPSIAWERIYFFWGDERHVPPEHPQSNYRMANELLLSKVPVPRENIFRIEAEDPAEEAAQAYEQTIRDFFKVPAAEIPRFDLILLGMGAEGHVASLFPGTRALQENERLVVANWVDKLKAHRITMTLPLLNNGAYVLFLVSGADKADALQRVFAGGDLPAALVRPGKGRLLWMVDREAAGALGG